MAVAGEEFDILDRQVEFRAFGIFQRDAGMGRAKGGDGFDAEITPDAVFDMHHQIAGGEAVHLAQEVFGLAAAARLGHQPVAQHILFGDDGKARGGEPGLERPDHQEQSAFAIRHFAHVLDALCARHALIGEQPFEPFARAVGP